MGAMSPGPWVQSGRVFSAEEIAAIRATVAWLPGLARQELAATLCEHLDWYTLTGTPKLDACGELLVRLEAAGLLVLPAVRPAGRPRRVPPGAPKRPRRRCAPRWRRSGRSTWRWCRRRRQRCSGTRRSHAGTPWASRGPSVTGCATSSPPASSVWAVCCWPGPRGRSWCAINGSGGTPRPAGSNRVRMLNNSRFLIFPHVQVPHLASHVLGQLARRVRADWQQHWGFEPLLLETFVDPRHYAGTCYRAAGWELLGQTSGRGLARPGQTYRSTPRQVWVKPLSADWRTRLCAGAGNDHE